MKTLTPTGEQFVAELATRFSLSRESVARMIAAVDQGNGTMAQFSCPEFGSGQWMRGGMTMVSDMFNDRLKANVNEVCNAISVALQRDELFNKEEVQGLRATSSQWWPEGLGTPSSVGAQNRTRYAVFPGTRRLVTDRDGEVTVYDTGDHLIAGVGQQQGTGEMMSFTSQHGTVSLESLGVVSGGQGGPASKPTEPKPSSPSPADAQPSSSEIPALLEKLGKLRDAGVLSEDEFKTKKSELLARL